MIDLKGLNCYETNKGIILRGVTKSERSKKNPDVVSKEKFSSPLGPKARGYMFLESTGTGLGRGATHSGCAQWNALEKT